MPWDKPSEALIARFDACLPKDAAVERRKMFGCPCVFVNGNMFAGLHEQNLILRLDEAGRARACADHGAGPFTVMGRTMREYVALPGAGGRPAADVTRLVAEAFAYAKSLPPKQPKKRQAAPDRNAARKR